MKKVLLIFISWRIALVLVLLIGYSFITQRSGYEYTLFSNYLFHEGLSNNELNYLLSVYANFDGVHYITIAYQGYTVNAGFFPLFPIIISLIAKALSFVLPIDLHLLIFYSGLVINVLFSITGLLFFYKLLKLDYKAHLIYQVVLFLLCFPTSFFFAAIYSESLFFLLLVLTFYFTRRKQWFIAALFASLLTATRPIGIAILPAILFELYVQKKIDYKKLFHQPLQYVSLWLTAFFVTAVSLLGIGIYSLFNYQKWHDFLYFIHAQGEFKNNRTVSSIVFFPQTIYRYIKILFTVSSSQFEWWIALLELSTFFFICLLLFIAWKQKVRMSYIIFAILSFLIPISTGTFSSLPRYALVLFPIFIALALIKSKTIKIICVVIGIILQILLFLLFSKGYFVG